MTKDGRSIVDDGTFDGCALYEGKSGVTEPQQAQGHWDGQPGMHEGRQARHWGGVPLHAPGNNPDVPTEGSGT